MKSRFRIQNLKLKTWTSRLNVKTSQNNLGLTCQRTNKHQLDVLTSVLTGDHTPISGQIMLSNINLITASRFQRSLMVIKSHPFLFRVFPVQFLLVRKLVLNWKFFLPAHINYLQKKYHQEFIMQTTPNLKLTYFYLKIDRMVQTLITRLTATIEHQIKIKKNEIFKKITQFWTSFNAQKTGRGLIANKIVELIKNKIDAWLTLEKLTMLQALSDAIQQLDNVYYVWLNKKQDSKENQKSKRKMCSLIKTKHLRILKTKILFQRLITIQSERNFKNQRRKLSSSIDNKLIRQDLKWSLGENQVANLKIFEDWRTIYQNWKNNVISFRVDYWTSQMNTSISNLIQKIVNQAKTILNPHNRNHLHFVIQPKTEPPLSILLQAATRVKNLLQEINLKINWFKLTKNLSSFALIIIELINAYFIRSKVLLVKNLVNKLTQEELRTIKLLLTKLRNLGWNFFLINLEVVNNRRPPTLCDHYLSFDNVLKSD